VPRPPEYKFELGDEVVLDIPAGISSTPKHDQLMKQGLILHVTGMHKDSRNGLSLVRVAESDTLTREDCLKLHQDPLVEWHFNRLKEEALNEKRTT
jgi:hypothetical protein